MLGAIVAIQAACALFFLGDALADAIWPDGDADADRDYWFEAVVSVALALGVFFGASELRRAMRRAATAESALTAASGAFADLIRARFEEWRLTPAEGEVALLALKGFETKEIARLRSAADGTVRAQLAKIYSKAGVSNRGQLVSHFIDDLMDGALVQKAA